MEKILCVEDVIPCKNCICFAVCLSNYKWKSPASFHNLTEKCSILNTYVHISDTYWDEEKIYSTIDFFEDKR